IAACTLPEILNEVALKRAIGPPSARLHLSLPDMLSGLDAKLRQRVYSAIIASGEFLAGEPIRYSFELLRATFNDFAKSTAETYHKDPFGIGHTDFNFQ